tara:strand:- start:32 stop:532 length:501 start_codon:yes stop_codon:yes gene_type:complete
MLEDDGVLKKQIYYIEGSADELIERIRSEGENTKADVFHDSRCWKILAQKTNIFLRKDEAAVAAGVELPEELGEHLELAAVPLDEPLVGERERLPDKHRLLAPQRRVRDRAERKLAEVGRVGLARVVSRAQPRRRRAALADLRGEGFEDHLRRGVPAGVVKRKIQM